MKFQRQMKNGNSAKQPTVREDDEEQWKWSPSAREEAHLGHRRVLIPPAVVILVVWMSVCRIPRRRRVLLPCLRVLAVLVLRVRRLVPLGAPGRLLRERVALGKRVSVGSVLVWAVCSHDACGAVRVKPCAHRAKWVRVGEAWEEEGRNRAIHTPWAGNEWKEVGGGDDKRKRE
jgi:hypothetical protein